MIGSVADIPFFLVNFTGEVKPFVPGSVDRQTPVDFSDDVT